MKLHFEAKKHSYRQTQDGVVVSFVMHPNEVNPEFAASPLGTRFIVALAEIDEDEQPKVALARLQAEPTEVEYVATRYADGSLTRELEPAPKTYKNDGERAVTKAVMLCKDKAFQEWVGGGQGASEAQCREFIIARCGIAASRSEFKDNVDARMKLYTLITRFESETGRIAERR